MAAATTPVSDPFSETKRQTYGAFTRLIAWSAIGIGAVLALLAMTLL